MLKWTPLCIFWHHNGADSMIKTSQQVKKSVMKQCTSFWCRGSMLVWSDLNLGLFCLYQHLYYTIMSYTLKPKSLAGKLLTLKKKNLSSCDWEHFQQPQKICLYWALLCGCLYLGSFWKFSQASKLRFFFLFAALWP